MRNQDRLPISLYAGLFLVTLATLMFEILLTRIFSVTMWYHFAFMAISVAMFGMTIGALIVYLLPGVFTPERARRQMGLAALAFGIAVAVCFLAYLCVPFVDAREATGTLLYVSALALIYTLVALPFVPSGVCVCLALTRFPRSVSRLYAVDLIGAAAGCIALVLLLDWTDGPTAVFVVSALALLGAACLFGAAGLTRWLSASLVLALAGGAFVVDNTARLPLRRSRVPLLWIKGQLEGPLLYDKWNTFSRLTVRGNPRESGAPLGWGLSPRLPADTSARHLVLLIDGQAATPLVGFRGDLERVRFLRYDITNLAHSVSPATSVLVIGAGGGRDVLSALVFDQAHVTAVELNGNTLAAVNGVFGDFTGHLDRQPNVRFVHDEARSWLERDPNRYGLIQISLIDTWAATAAGAFALSENSLYTQEAWQLFLARLAPDGLLSVSRWHLGKSPSEVYRMVALARAALEMRGVADVRPYLFMARFDRLATLLVSPSPFSPERLRQLERTCTELGFEVPLSPTRSADEILTRLTQPGDVRSYQESLTFNIAPPTDDSPFFFNMLRPSRVFRTDPAARGTMEFNARAIHLLVALLLVVLTLTAGCVVLPLFLGADRSGLRPAWALLLFFAAIGFGFMLIEVAIMQRLSIFLGHPVFGLSVMLFALLLSSGLGSLSTGRVDGAQTTPWPRLAALLGALAVSGLAIEPIIRSAAGQSTPVRIAIAVLMIAPMGFFMGMAFPLGMKAALARAANLTPWLWGMNGATSVCASVVAMLLALSFGIRVTFWAGFGCYVAAGLALAHATRSLPSPAPRDAQ